jgi:hypothetical protein
MSVGVLPWPRRRGHLPQALGFWAAWYAAYRFYYAFGGHVGMIGRPAPAAHFRHDNLVGGTIILLAAVLPSIAAAAWRHRLVKAAVPVVGWIAAVGCCMHALTLEILRVLSLSGLHPHLYPSGLWLSVDRHRADLQDVLFNEPWFLVEGCLWGLFALAALEPPSRRLWCRSAVVVCVAAAVVGVSSGLGAIPTFRAG